MRNAILILLLLLVGALCWYAISRDRSAGPPVPALRPGGGPPEVAHDGTSPGPEFLPPARSSTPATADGTLRVVEGTVLDRFGYPVIGERVFLLAADQEHPAAGAPLADYPKTLTSSEGRFVLTSRSEGPWRLGVGPPGSPRIPPSEPRTLTGAIGAEAVVPGSAALRIALAELPETELPLVLELLVLHETPPSPVAPPPTAPRPLTATNPGTPISRQEAEQRDRSDKEAEAAEEEAEGGGAEDGGAESLAEGRARGAVPLDRSGSARRQNDPGGYRGIAPPAEIWEQWKRHRITEEELAEGVAGFSNLPSGDILRLNLMVGAQRIEGTLRFSPRPDSLTEVRILSLSTGSGAKFAYVASLQLLAPDESPPGIRWLD